MERVTDPVEVVLETLISRGWRFRDPDVIRDLIRSKANSASSSSLDSVESELLKMDLRSIGGKSLADPSAMKKLSHLQGPKILQLVSIRDIYQNSIDSSFKNSQNHRLLRFTLTDGHSEITAIEYAPIPSINEEIVPGTKVRLDNKILVHSGILCLNPKVVTVMGGVVQSLYEEWQMSQKYSGISRSNLRRSQNDDNVGPPPFEKLQVEVQSYHESMPHGSLGQPGPFSKISSHMNEKTYGRHMGRYEEHKVVTSGGSHLNDGSKMIPSTKNSEENPSTSEARPKEVSEAVPVQNQAAAQKLLQKLSQPTHHPRSQKHRLRDKHEEAQVFTLDEWERRKASTLKHTAVDEARDVSRDEELARQLQNQLDLEDFHARTGNAEAEQIRMNMFSYTGEEDKRNEGGRGFRGRGRGRGRGRRFG